MNDLTTTATSNLPSECSGVEGFIETREAAFKSVCAGRWNALTRAWDGELPSLEKAQRALSVAAQMEVPAGDMDRLAVAKALMMAFPNSGGWEERRRAEYISQVARALRRCPAGSLAALVDPLFMPWGGYTPPSAPDVAKWAREEEAKIAGIRWLATKAIEVHNERTPATNPVPMERRREIMEEVGGMVAKAAQEMRRGA